MSGSPRVSFVSRTMRDKPASLSRFPFRSPFNGPRDEEIHKRDARRFGGIVCESRFAAKRDFPPTSGVCVGSNDDDDDDDARDCRDKNASRRFFDNSNLTDGEWILSPRIDRPRFGASLTTSKRIEMLFCRARVPRCH